MKKLLLLLSMVLLTLSCLLGINVASANTKVFVDVGRHHPHYYPSHRHSHYYRKPYWKRHHHHHHSHSRYY